MAIENLRRRVIEQIKTPKERDLQTRVGPSGLGNPCPKCLGREMAGEPAEQDFSLFPWIGTAGHEFLENHTFPEYQHERKVYVGEVPGYGPIKGTTDMTGDGSVVDWKFVGKKKITEYRLRGVREQYRFQAHLYGRGVELEGDEVDSVSIVFIPRDSGNVEDIWVHTEEYNPDMAQAALDRAGVVYGIVLEQGWQALPSDEDCWTCRMEGLI